MTQAILHIPAERPAPAGRVSLQTADLERPRSWAIARSWSSRLQRVDPGIFRTPERRSRLQACVKVYADALFATGRFVTVKGRSWVTPACRRGPGRFRRTSGFGYP